MKIMMMGPQACGKGTQGEKLGEKLGLPVFGSGQLLRDVPVSNPRYEEIRSIMDKGELVPQNFVAELIKNRISQDDYANGFIIDGWFRNMEDVKQLDLEPDLVFVISIPREESVKRITGRRFCPANGKTYNIYTLPPEQLKECPGELVQREDDTEEAVNRRLDIYYSDTMKVIDLLKSRGTKVVEVDGMGTPDEVFSRVVSNL